MSLSSDLISQFAKITNDTKPPDKESTLQGIVVEYEGVKYVKLDGSELLTPIETTVDTSVDERVIVTIKDHTAIVTGNISSPAARTEDVKDAKDKINEFDTIISYKLTTENIEAINATIQNLLVKTARFENMEAVEAEIHRLHAKFIEVEHLSAKDVEAINADIENLRAIFGKFTNISTEDLDAINADITNLSGHTADFTYVSADVLVAIKARVKELDAKKISADDADIKYANIDFANIGEAAIRKIFADSGLIYDLKVGDHTVTGELVGVTISGDLIKAKTLVAEKLVVRGSDGKLYKLNQDFSKLDGVTPYAEDQIHGSNIVAKSITAEQVSVKDLVAFGATIADFKIEGSTETSPGRIYSGAKNSPTNTTRGIYQDTDGQFAVGDSNNFLKFYKDENGVYKLAIQASEILLGSEHKNVEQMVEDELDNINIGGRNFIRNGLMFTGYYFESKATV